MLICQQSITKVGHTNQIQGDYNMQTKKFILVFTVNGTLRLISYEEAVKLLLHEKSRPSDFIKIILHVVWVFRKGGTVILISLGWGIMTP